MKNIHVIATDKPSRLVMYSKKLNRFRLLDESCDDWKGRLNIYITSDEEIIGGKEWFLDLRDNFMFKNQVTEPMNKVLFPNFKKIILTTDQDLIKDNVQAIDDEFLEWFVKNPSCEEVETGIVGGGKFKINGNYGIIIPKKEPKQETLEEVAERKFQNIGDRLIFEDGAKWQQERSYSEEEVLELFQKYISTQIPLARLRKILHIEFLEWFEQFKKK